MPSLRSILSEEGLPQKVPGVYRIDDLGMTSVERVADRFAALQRNKDLRAIANLLYEKVLRLLPRDILDPRWEEVRIEWLDEEPLFLTSITDAGTKQTQDKTIGEALSDL